MLKQVIFIALTLVGTTVIAQNIGLNESGDPPHPSAMLDIVSTNKGILIPRLPDHTTIAAPAQGLLVYNSTGNGFWYWDGTQWLPLLGANAGWQILGNNGIDPLINFLGTTDNAALMFRVADTPAGRIDWDALVSGSTTGRKGVTALGYNALSAVTSGYHNTAIGFNAGNSITTGFGNTIMGFNAATSLQSNHSNVVIGELAGSNMASGNENIIIGNESGYNLSDNQNIFIGWRAGYSATTSTQNTLIGYRAGHNMTTGGRNIYLGFEAGHNTTSGNRNIFVGEAAGRSVTTGNRNIFIGELAGRDVTTGDRNVFIGERAGYPKASGRDNISIGWLSMGEGAAFGALENVAIGSLAGRRLASSGNVFVGFKAGENVTNTDQNTFVGARSGSGGTSTNPPGSNNSFFGFQTGKECFNCVGNTFLGSRAGDEITTGVGNVFIGFGAGFNLDISTSNRLVIANNLTNNDILVFGHFDTKRLGINTITPTHTLSVNGNAFKSDGNVQWDIPSDERIKDITGQFHDGLEVVLKLNPVRFKYNAASGHDQINQEYVGFIAQEVEGIVPYMVTVIDDSDGPSGLADKRILNTSALNQILVNAVQEQHEQIQSLEERVSQLENLLLKVLNEKEAVAERK